MFVIVRDQARTRQRLVAVAAVATTAGISMALAMERGTRFLHWNGKLVTCWAHNLLVPSFKRRSNGWGQYAILNSLQWHFTKGKAIMLNVCWNQDCENQGVNAIGGVFPLGYQLQWPNYFFNMWYATIFNRRMVGLVPKIPSIMMSPFYPNGYHIIGYPYQEFGCPYIGLIGKQSLSRIRIPSIWIFVITLKSKRRSFLFLPTWCSTTLLLTRRSTRSIPMLGVAPRPMDTAIVTIRRKILLRRKIWLKKQAR